MINRVISYPHFPPPAASGFVEALGLLYHKTRRNATFLQTSLIPFRKRKKGQPKPPYSM